MESTSNKTKPNKRSASKRQADSTQTEATKYLKSSSLTSQTEKRTTSKLIDPTGLKATKFMEFSVKGPEDTANVRVTSVLDISDNIIVVDKANRVLKLFDQSGTYLSSTYLEKCTWGITCVHDSTFATCGYGNIVYPWTVRRQTIVREDLSYHVDHDAYGIHCNGTYYCVLHHTDNSITILDSHGRQVRKIIMEEAYGKKVEFGWDIHMDRQTNNIYVPCWKIDSVLCMTIEGQALWLNPLSGNICIKSITEIQRTLCVAGYGDSCLHLVTCTKEGEYVRKLLDKEDLGGKPDYICYGQNGKVYVSYGAYDGKHHIIGVFSC